MCKRTFLIGSYAPAGTDSILRVELDTEWERLDVVRRNDEAEQPSWLLMHPNGQVLYAVEELVPDGRIATFVREGDGWRLTRRLPAGSAPCHLCLDSEAKWLLASNYMDGTLSVYELDETGLPLRQTDLLRHSGVGCNPERQEGPHIHSALWLGDEIYVADLGLDIVSVCTLDRATGKLREVRQIHLPAGSGPRHICPSATQPNLIYVNTELGGDVFVVDRVSGDILQTARVVPEDFTEDFRVSSIKRCGNCLYVGSRECNAVTLFRLREDGLLGERRIYRHRQETPRDVWMDEDWAITADEGSHGLTLLRRDGLALREVSFTATGEAQPTCILPL